MEKMEDPDIIDNIYYNWSGNRELNKWIEKCNRSVPLPGQGLSVNKERLPLPFADKQLNESESGPNSSFSISTSNFISPTNLGRMTKNYLNLMIPIETTRKQRLSSILFTRMRGRKKSSQIQLCLPHHIKKEHQSSNRKEEERILFYSALNWVFVYLSEIYTTSKLSLIFNFSLKVAQFHTKRIYLHNVKCNKSWKSDTFKSKLSKNKSGKRRRRYLQILYQRSPMFSTTWRDPEEVVAVFWPHVGHVDHSQQPGSGLRHVTRGLDFSACDTREGGHRTEQSWRTELGLVSSLRCTRTPLAAGWASNGS